MIDKCPAQRGCTVDKELRECLNVNNRYWMLHREDVYTKVKNRQIGMILSVIDMMRDYALMIPLKDLRE